MTQGVWDYRAEYASEREALLDCVDRVFSSGQLVLGASVAGFEAEFAAYHGVRHAVGLDNGTNALVLGLRALGVGPGDEVVTVSNTAAPTVVAITAVGATPVFVDVHRDTQLMDVTQLPSVITDRTAAIVPVHLYGQAVDMGALLEITAGTSIRVLEDCAQAHGATSKGRPVGTLGEAGAFSFYPTKVLGAYGDGGALITNDDEIAAAVRRLRYYGMDERYYVEQVPAYNSRLDEVQAEILRHKLARLPAYIDQRRAIAARYAAGLGGLPGLHLPSTAPGNTHVYYLYVARHQARDHILEFCRERGINLNVSYQWPCHTMRGFLAAGCTTRPLPVTEALSAEVFSLPMYPSLTADDQNRVIDTVRLAIR